MNRRTLFSFALIVTLALAACLRLPQLAHRPMHGDEANNILIFRDR